MEGKGLGKGGELASSEDPQRLLQGPPPPWPPPKTGTRTEGKAVFSRKRCLPHSGGKQFSHRGNGVLKGDRPCMQEQGSTCWEAPRQDLGR